MDWVHLLNRYRKGWYDGELTLFYEYLIFWFRHLTTEAIRKIKSTEKRKEIIIAVGKNQ